MSRAAPPGLQKKFGREEEAIFAAAFSRDL
jgi:hypothetical protein